MPFFIYSFLQPIIPLFLLLFFCSLLCPFIYYKFNEEQYSNLKGPKKKICETGDNNDNEMNAKKFFVKLKTFLNIDRKSNEKSVECREFGMPYSVYNTVDVVCFADIY